MESRFNITIDRKVIKLLGEHLYGDTPSVVNELIANAYDAGANKVWITIKTTSPYRIVVQDDGIGMDLSDINDFYLNIGYNRREEENLRRELKESNVERQDMGQKGIGKLAVFALSKIVRLISYKNGKSIGCLMNFDEICKPNGQPEEFDPSEFDIDESFLSINKSGTCIILENVAKDLSKSYKFIIGRIARSFILNNEIKVFIRKNDDEFKEVKRSELDFFENMDVLAVINGHEDLINRVKENTIDEKYKQILKYSDLVKSTQSQSTSTRFDALPQKIKVFNKERTEQIDYDFAFHGWIGTVYDIESFKSILKKNGYTDKEISDKDTIIVDDNRVSVYSRGKVGEYNILPKLQTKAANDAYVIGEIFVDAFEEDFLIDMATSNRRGYQEDDSRYETLVRNLKLLVSKVVSSKQTVMRQRKKDKEQAEENKIKSDFSNGHIKSRDVFNNMSDDDKRKVEDDHRQFTRAISLNHSGDASKKKLLISHRQDELRSYGDFIIDILLKLNPELKDRIVFTSNPEYGLPMGRDIFESLKECFRPDFYIVFLFTKSFYDSNACLAEAGAAWATNTNYMNIVVDISFSDIDKPLNNSSNGAEFKFDNEDKIKLFANTIAKILKEIDKDYPISDIFAAVKQEIKEKRATLKLSNYCPKRKFQYVPICNKCKKTMKLRVDDNEVKYLCDGINHSIDAKLE